MIALASSLTIWVESLPLILSFPAALMWSVMRFAVSSAALAWGVSNIWSIIAWADSG